MGDKENEEETPPLVQEKFSLAIHAVLDACQASHGLRHDDYKQYHGYCTRRLSRLRHAQPVRRDLVHSSTYVSGEKMRRNAYCPRGMPDTVEHENVLWVMLMGAERAWAHSCELKQAVGQGSSASLAAQHEKSRSSPGQIRQHALRRLKRAKQLATLFLEKIQEVGDERTIQEAKAYAGWMQGNYSLEVGDWKSACEEYGLSMSICRALSQAVEDDSLELRDLFTARASNVLQPLLRYCQYEYREAGGTVAMEEEHNVPQEQQQKTSAAGGGGTIYFRGMDIGVENKALRVLLLKLEGLYGAPQSDDKFVSLLSTYDDAIALVSADLKNVESMKAGPAVNAKKEQLQGLIGYAKNAKLHLLMKRNEDMVNDLRQESPTAHADIAHLYDALLQDARAVCGLPGPEVEDEFILEANANVLRLRAFRCFYASQLYVESNKHKEGLALLKQADLLTNRASEEIAACEDMKGGEEYLEALEQLGKDIVGATCRVKALAFLQRQGEHTGAATTSRGLLLRLDEFDGGRVLVDVPPAPISIPCKPAFFDVAWNYASAFPVDELQEIIDEQTAQQSKGLMSWFRSK